MEKRYSLALVGVTGLAGREVLKILEESGKDFDVEFLASERSMGERLEYRGKEVKVNPLKADSFKGIDFAIFTAGGRISKEFVPIAAKEGTICIDNSSVFRMEADVPLVVPEVNSDALKDFSKRGIIANPNCTTAQLVVVLAPIHRKAKIKRAVISTYQSVSGAGKKAIDELSEQVVALFNNKEVKVNRFPHQIAFNCIPHIDIFDDKGNSREEVKVINETKKIMGSDNIGISVTAVRVPTFSCHSEAVNIECQEHIDAASVAKILAGSKGVSVVDDTEKKIYPLPLDAVGTDDVYVGRIRDDNSTKNAVNLWIVADNLRKGAALNAVQILNTLIKDYY